MTNTHARSSRRRTHVILTAATALALLTGCAGTEVTDGPSAEDLEGDWVLSHGSGPEGDIPIVDTHRPTLAIDGEDWGGTVCNHYGATATVSGNDLRIGDVFQTEMACVDDGVMESEAAYLDAFRQATEVEIVAGRLVLRDGSADDGDGEIELVYTRLEPEEDLALVGTTWRLESLVHGAAPDAAVSQAMSPVELELREDGSLQAATGCRRIRGPYHLDGDLLDLTEVTIDGQECDDAQLAEQDEHLEATLLAGTAIRVEVDGSTLRLTAPGGGGLHYRAG